MKLLKFLLGATALLAMTACSDDPTQNIDPSDQQVNIEDNKDKSYISSLTLSQQEQSIVNANNDFAWKFFNETSNDKSENVVVSPLSVSIAMTMMANGAFEGSPVQKEIFTALGYDNKPLSEINATSMKIADGINRLDEDVDLTLANSLWIQQQKFMLNPDFVSVLKKDFSAEYYPIIKSTYISDVNHWSDIKTNGMIKELLPPSANIPDMAIINATYFKGLWGENDKFNEYLTAKDKFYGADGRTSNVDFMNAVKISDSYKNDKMEMITIPFGNGNYQFCIVRPNDNTSIAECIASMMSGKWNELMMTTPTKEYLSVKLPKFDIEYSQSIHETLANIGMRKAVSAPDYYFAFPNGLEIKEILQKTKIRINEEGAEAASDTYIDVIAGEPEPGGNLPTTQPRPFHLDHPFIYLITEKTTGTIIFIGCVNSL